MIHWNEESEHIRDVHPHVAHFFRFGLPEIYQAASLGDFYFNRQEIIPTRRGGIIGLIHNGSSHVIIGPGASYTPISPKEGSLRDITCSFNVLVASRIRSLLSSQNCPLRLYDLVLGYHVAKDLVSLLAFSPYGPEGPQHVSRSVLDRFLECILPQPSLRS